MSEPEKVDHGRFAIPATTRSRLMLEAASELVGEADFPQRQVTLSLRVQGATDWPFTFLASDTPSAIDEVVSGRAQIAIVNPSSPLTLAYRGAGPYKEPLPVRAITVIPSEDQMAFAVTEASGLRSIEDIGERRFPLKMGMRAQRDHACFWFVEQVFQAAGFSLEDVLSWGGEVKYLARIPQDLNRIEAVRRGEVDAIFDEAVNRWLYPALDAGMRLLDLTEGHLAKLEQMGFRRGIVKRADYPRLDRDVLSLDFSGWPVFARADAPDDLIARFCAALEARKASIPWQGAGPLPLEWMCKDTPETPLDVPLHPAAERFWQERGYLGV
ncbi:MAG TPA: TAXI family TRAP transporter solute-binding subunit [Chloroflexota bacterium]|nr:TAXI family TRAP transporter solute-binding subunit [Chloroflexota bacterium]